jgi:hypothetical protein
VQRVAIVYTNTRSALPPAVRTLLRINDVECRVLDITDDPSTLDWIREKSRSLELPVVELEGRFTVCSNIQHVARTLKLQLSSTARALPNACC